MSDQDGQKILGASGSQVFMVQNCDVVEKNLKIEIKEEPQDDEYIRGNVLELHKIKQEPETVIENVHEGPKIKKERLEDFVESGPSIKNENFNNWNDTSEYVHEGPKIKQESVKSLENNPELSKEIQKRRLFKCHICGQLFEDLKSLNTHTVHERCDYKSKDEIRARNEKILKKIREKNNEDVYDINNDDTFEKPEDPLAVKEKDVKKVNKYQCNTCGESFQTLKSINEHLIDLSGHNSSEQDKLPCVICGLEFSRPAFRDILTLRQKTISVNLLHKRQKSYKRKNKILYFSV